MKKWHDEIPYNFDNPMTAHILTENVLLFDIETTGFSPAHTQLYLIGCASRKGNKLIVDQFFAEHETDEKMLLLAFLHFSESFDTLVSFNGTGFDIPYLKAKCDLFHLPEHFSSYTYIDIFKIVSKIKFLLKTENYKQKSMEHFLGIHRNDELNGGELIEVYKNYLKNPSGDALFLLKQHNYEDVICMPSLLPLLSYGEILNGNYTISSIEGNEYQSMAGENKKELLLTLSNDYPVPKRVSCGSAFYYLTMYKDKTQIRIQLYDGELKFFFKDYKNYYYLPTEDTAIHKSVSAYVDKAHRQPATAQNCYTRKAALFVPQYQEIMNPVFVENYKDKLTFFELTEDFTESDIMLRRYVNQIFQTFYKTNRKNNQK